jgi:predicted HicB family RNase H-like nuclease
MASKQDDEFAPHSTPASGDPTDETPTSRPIIVRLSPATHRALRVRVAEEDTSIQRWVESLIERALGIPSSR